MSANTPPFCEVPNSKTTRAEAIRVLALVLAIGGVGGGWAVVGEDPGTAFEAAVAAVQRAAHAQPERSEAYYSELERGFRALQRRFPGEAQVYAELLFVADHRAGEAGLVLAREVESWPAPEAVKAKARGLIQKRSMLGRAVDFRWPALQGGEIDFKSLRGRVVLVDFWATWCPPCREELPRLKALYTRCHDRGLEIVGVSFDERPDTVRSFLRREGIAWSQVADGRGWEGPRAAELGLTSLPTKWLIDRSGKLRELDLREGLSEAVEKLLGE